jgi:hypothetical protein
MADRMSRGPLGVLGAVLALSLVALLISWARGSWTASRVRLPMAKAVKIDGLSPAKISVLLDVAWRVGAESALRADIAQASGISGLYDCAPNPPDFSSMPEPPGFFCSATRAFSTAGLATLERLPRVATVGGGTAGRHNQSLFFLGVLRGEPALIVSPIGNDQRVQADLAVLRSLSGVLHCGWSAEQGPFLTSLIGCATSSHGAAVQAQRVAKHLNVAYAEVIASW